LIPSNFLSNAHFKATLLGNVVAGIVGGGFHGTEADAIRCLYAVVLVVLLNGNLSFGPDL